MATSTAQKVKQKATTIFNRYATYETIANKIQELAEANDMQVEFSGTSHYSCNDTVTLRDENGTFVEKFDCSDKKINHSF
jgi:hypothetical protein